MALRRLNFRIFNLAKSARFDELVVVLAKVSQDGARHTLDFSPEKQFSKWTALHYAAAGGIQAEVAITKLLQLGWSPTCKGQDGKTPLALAKLRKQENIIHLLKWYAPYLVSQRASSNEKKTRRKKKRYGGEVVSKKPRPVNHLIPCVVPDMQPDEGYFSFDELVTRWKKIDPKWKPPRSKYLL